MKASLFTSFLLVVLATTTSAQTPFVGNTLITPVRSTHTFLIDMDFNTIHNWHGDNGAGHTVYLLPDHSVLRSQGDPNGIFGGGGSGGHLQRIDANDNVVWDYFFSNDSQQQHHDIEPMANGNVLILAWEVRTNAEAIALGRTAPTGPTLAPTLIVELEPVGTNDAKIVWEWRIWEHLIQDTDPTKPIFGVIADHPELLDINLGGANRSWDHGNHIDYNPQLDQIVYSARRMNEVLVIDHSTTTEEAAGHTGGNSGRGGDILYRWGNPENYGRGTAADRHFNGVHGANWINAGLPGAGGILAFNNGNLPGDVNDRSSVAEIQPPRGANNNYVIAPGQPYGPATPDWEYAPDLVSFFSIRYGSAYRLPNGNTLIDEGVDGLIFEVTPDLMRVWGYLEPAGNGVFAAKRYWSVPAADAHIDIEPRSCPNNFSLRRALDPGAGQGQDQGQNRRRNRRGRALRVAIAGSAGLDVTQLEVASLRLEGIAPIKSKFKDVTTPAGGCACTTEGPDGFEDLELRFDREEVASVLGAVGDGAVVPLTITGTMLDGAFFEASDCVTVVERTREPPSIAEPDQVTLHPAAPNPFNPVTVIRYDLVETAPVSLNVYDVTGRLVRTLVNEVQSPAASGYSVTWDGRSNDGRPVSSGIYFYRLVTRNVSMTKKMMLLK